MCYTLLNLVACVINVLLDLVITYFTVLVTAIGLGVRAHSGLKLTDLHTFEDRFETYPVQKALGQNLME